MRLNGRESPAKPWSDRFLVRRAQHTIREQETADGYESANATSAGHCFWLCRHINRDMGDAARSYNSWQFVREFGRVEFTIGSRISREGLRATSQCAAQFFTISPRIWLQGRPPGVAANDTIRPMTPSSATTS
jgi:hypothetical protein